MQNIKIWSLGTSRFFPVYAGGTRVRHNLTDKLQVENLTWVLHNTKQESVAGSVTSLSVPGLHSVEW
jgi:hypothetical protein